MQPVPVVFLGTPAFACESLRALIDSEKFKVVGVVSQPDRPAGRKMKLQASPVTQLALDANIPVITPEKVSTPESLKIIASWKADAAVVVAFGQILSQEFLDMFPKQVVNVHGSLLPRWRGAAPIQRAIMAGDKQTGVCLQVMVKKLDAGDVIGERKIAISETTTASELHDEMAKKAGSLLTNDFVDYLEGNLAPIKQDESLVTYAPKIEKSEGLIDWSQPAAVISGKIRGLNMGPGTFTNLDGKKMKIHSAKVVAEQKASPGEIWQVTPTSFSVACGEGSLLIDVVQPESKPKMAVSEYLKGRTIEVGQKFG